MQRISEDSLNVCIKEWEGELAGEENKSPRMRGGGRGSYQDDSEK